MELQKDGLSLEGPQLSRPVPMSPVRMLLKDVKLSDGGFWCQGGMIPGAFSPHIKRWGVWMMRDTCWEVDMYQSFEYGLVDRDNTRLFFDLLLNIMISFYPLRL